MRKIDTRSFVRATRTTAREINQQITLNLVREHQPISRAELARRLNVGRGMVTSLVDALLAQSAIYEGAAGVARRGRKPTMLYLRTRDRLAIAIDIRFSYTSVMLSDFAGNALDLLSFETLVDPVALVAALRARVRQLLTAHDVEGRCEGVGVVVPGMVDYHTGRVLNAPQLGWRDIDFRTSLADALGLPVQIENAPLACAHAQLWFGQRTAASPRDFAYLTVSDGVGVGVVIDGQVVRGHGHTTGEFGHLPLNLDGPRCLCGAQGCLEAYTSNLATLARYHGEEFSPERARSLLHSGRVSIADIITGAAAGEARAGAALDETARYLGIGIAGIINALSPAQLFVGGEITAAWDRVAPTIQAAVAARALTTAAAAVPIVPDFAHTHPRLRGAAALVAAPTFAAPQIA